MKDTVPHPVDQNYQSLKCRLSIMDKKSKEFKVCMQRNLYSLYSTGNLEFKISFKSGNKVKKNIETFYNLDLYTVNYRIWPRNIAKSLKKIAIVSLQFISKFEWKITQSYWRQEYILNTLSIMLNIYHVVLWYLTFKLLKSLGFQLCTFTKLSCGLRCSAAISEMFSLS